MNQTINLHAWLNGPSRPRTSYDLYCLWQACRGRSGGNYHVEEVSKGLRIMGAGSQVLFLPSAKSIADFKAAIEGISVQPVKPTVWSVLPDDQVDRPDRVKLPPPKYGSQRFSSR